MKARNAFTSDTHFWHKKMMVHRGFPSLEGMHERMILDWNDTVAAITTVFHLGDVSFAGFTRTQEIIGQLNGILKIIPGNHDDPNMLRRLHTKHAEVEVMPNLMDLKIGEHNEDGSTDVLRFALCHYPLRVWNRSHYGAMHLHGHSHGFLPASGRMLDVGIDGPATKAYGPVTLAEVKAWMATCSFVQHDQHEEQEDEHHE